MEQSSYILTTIILNVVTLTLWVWQAVIKVQEKRPWHSYGCICYAVSYAMFIWVNMDVYKLSGDPLVINNVMKVYFGYMFQLAATISFLIFTYTKDHAKLAPKNVN